MYGKSKPRTGARNGGNQQCCQYTRLGRLLSRSGRNGGPAFAQPERSNVAECGWQCLDTVDTTTDEQYLSSETTVTVNKQG